MDVLELIRLLRARQSTRAITRLLGHNRRTIARYRAWAESQGLLDGPLPTAAQVQQLLTTTLPPLLPPQQTSSVACYADEIRAYRMQGIELAATKARLEERHGQPVSYHALWRWVRRHEPRTVDAVVRVEVPPGSEAQVDFGYAGLALDPATGVEDVREG